MLGCMAFLFSSCFDSHPYDVDISGEKGINARNIATIEQKCANKTLLRVAFISDTHLWLSEARDQVADLNKRDVDFVVHCFTLPRVCFCLMSSLSAQTGGKPICNVREFCCLSDRMRVVC